MRHAVLIFSSDPLAAALIGAAIELAEHTPLFPQDDESARNALRRVRPRLVVIDCDHEEACDDGFIGPALMTGSQVLLFRSRRTQRDIGDLGARLGVKTVEMPVEHATLTELLKQLVAGHAARGAHPEPHASATARGPRSGCARWARTGPQVSQPQAAGAGSPKCS